MGLRIFLVRLGYVGPKLDIINKSKKEWWSSKEDRWVLSGPRVQWPVILPPLEAGGIRCSVKPASRNTHHFRCWDVKAFTKASTTHYTTWNGQATNCATRPRPIRHTWHPHHLIAPARVTSNRYLLGKWGVEDCLFKVGLCLWTCNVVLNNNK